MRGFAEGVLRIMQPNARTRQGNNVRLDIGLRSERVRKNRGASAKTLKGILGET
jgi:hypothetical protein